MTERARVATTVTLSRGQISVDGERVENTALILKEGYWALPRLEERLKARRVEIVKVNALCRWLPAGLELCSAESRRIDATRLRIAASADTPYMAVKKLWFTANKAGFTRVHLLVSDESERVRQLALDSRPCEKWVNTGGCLAECAEWGPP